MRYRIVAHSAAVKCLEKKKCTTNKQKMSSSSSSIVLHCIEEGSGKIRVRIAAFIDTKGTMHTGVYRDELNCRFPRHLRKAGAVLRVPDGSVKLCGGNGTKHYYSVAAKGITLSVADNVVRAWAPCSECVVCMDAAVDIVFAPCGHSSTCSSCAEKLTNCCICRSHILIKIAAA